MDWEALIASSRVLTTPIPPADQPSDEALRRAISTAYYAMFHALATSNADCIVGVSCDPITSHAWDRVYRGLEHGLAKEQLQQDQQIFSPVTRHFGRAFGQLQDVRRAADYNNAETFTTDLANTWINRAEEAIRGFMQVSVDERTAVAVQSLIRRRRN
jgi:hypothetical protein